jgi:hypothetical protein
MQTDPPVRRSLFALLLLAACSYESPWTRQRKEAEALRPAEVKATPGVPKEALRTFKVRAYADPDYQAQTPRWNAHIEEQLDRASAVLEAQFGVRLELESARPWPRQGSSARLREVLTQLQAFDPGAQVDWVIGFTASLDVFSAAQDQLGVGAFFGKHIVLRGMASAAELDAIDRALNLLPAEDRATLVRQRRLHKETSVLLHEWAHTLGAFHDRATSTLMAPTYDPSMSQFSEASARVVGLGLDHRGAPNARAGWAKAYREQVAKSKDDVWDEVEKQHVLAAADEFFSSSSDLDPQDLKKLDEASMREHSGDLEKARALIAPLAARYPQSVMVQELSCAIAQEAHKDELATCRRAARLDGASPQILLMTARLTMDSAPRPRRAQARRRAVGLAVARPARPGGGRPLRRGARGGPRGHQGGAGHRGREPQDEGLRRLPRRKGGERAGVRRRGPRRARGDRARQAGPRPGQGGRAGQGLSQDARSGRHPLPGEEPRPVGEGDRERLPGGSQGRARRVLAAVHPRPRPQHPLPLGGRRSVAQAGDRDRRQHARGVAEPRCRPAPAPRGGGGARVARGVQAALRKRADADALASRVDRARLKGARHGALFRWSAP